MSTVEKMKKSTFTRYEFFIIAILATLQFTIVLDFMVLSPLGAQLLAALHITTSQFGNVVSAYAFSAGASGLLAAGFADRFDRKKLLLFFYVGFILGTLLCGIAPDYQFLLGARIVTGIFGGVISSVSFAIITDLFPINVRGRVMGFVQMSFAASQVLGIPVGLYLANHWGWHSPFLMIVGISIILGIVILVYMRPIDTHLTHQASHNAFQHLRKTVSQPVYLKAFAATALLMTGGFMLMPFASAFTVYNLGIPLKELPLIYMITGICAIVSGPLIGKLTDTIGSYKMFFIGSLLTMGIVVIYCNQGLTPLTMVIALNVFMFIGVSSRMISSQAMISAIPQPHDRGAFMGINSSVQQVSGGIATFIAGLIVVQTEKGTLERYDTLGYVVVGAMIITLGMMYVIHRYIAKKNKVAVDSPVDAIKLSNQ